MRQEDPKGHRVGRSRLLGQPLGPVGGGCGMGQLGGIPLDPAPAAVGLEE